jgi:hypothetical protein
MSCLQGYALTTYDYLVENMGEPEKLREGSYEDNPFDKLSVQWDMTSFYVYDWKEESTPKGIYYWHIGGESKQALKDFEDITGIPTIRDYLSCLMPKARQ